MQNTNPINPNLKPTWQQVIQLINMLLTPAKEAVVIVRPDPSYDTVCACMAISASLKKIGRMSKVIAAKELDKEEILKQAKSIEVPDAFHAGFDQITTNLPSKQLIMTIDYSNGSYANGKLDKAEKGLSITLIPEEGQQAIDPINMNAQIIESNPDVVFTLDLENQFNLGDFYQSNTGLFQKTIINIDNHKNNMNYGKANLLDPEAKSLSEMVTLMLYDLRFVIDEPVAKILYSGIAQKTENFSQKFYTANMLEATSIAMRYQKQARMQGSGK